MSIDYHAEVATLAAELRRRDKDPSYADAPIVDSYARISRRKSERTEDKTIVQHYRNLVRIRDDGYRLGELLTDEARSAWKEGGKRPAFDAVVKRAASGTSHGVAVRFADRLARQPWDLERLVKDATERAYRVVTADVTYRFDNWRSLDELRGEIRAGLRESAKKSERILDELSKRLSNGDGRNGAAPFGHRWRVTDIEDAQLALERAAIAWGIEYITDGHSWGEVARRWNADGVLPRRHPRWHAQNVRAALMLPRHAGLLVRKGNVIGTIADVDGPIVTLPQWHAFDAVVSKRRRGRQRGDTESRYYASGTVWCGGTRADGTPCETLLAGTAQAGVYADTGEPRYGYKCPPRGCKGVTVDGRAVEEHASFLAGKVIVAGNNVSLLAHVGHDDRLAELDKLISDAELAIDHKEQQRDAATHPSRRERIVAQLVDAESRLSALLNERDGLHETVRREQLKPSDVDELCALWDNPLTPAAVKRTIVRQCVPHGFYVKPVGKGARLRGEQIFTRFYERKGAAS